ncbi:MULTISPECIES: fasciclin domain-containing protein [unclassified Wenzhouxiangella]|uniref:fasciclin domain-containing protein n=1 Tax=unclassified Wenzhouxiangella TaxID=2613841 RepID=UPI000E32A03F|nr:MULTISPECIES: fasciclin domain-containing protein [unclassified Wenzhouxiangella]RFF27042.1 fasciclin domain-containing protein [Wenzhouxiangella sp. 15181]RFP67541.1 fasciclin domain-containing protein [Wenzhouxiangella sp. 15190]
MNVRKLMTLAGATMVLAASTAVLADHHGGKDKDHGKKEGKNIVETAVAAGQFDTLVTAVKEAGLVETLSGEGPFTVFAPTDEAFAKIPEADLNALLADKDALTSVLTYHVVAGKVKAADVVNLSEAETVQGSTVDITVDGDTVKIDDATVIKTDIETSNGVIHVIDTVIMP